MKLTLTEFNIMLTGLRLAKVDMKDESIVQAQMVAYAIGKKRPRWRSDFGDSESQRKAILFGEEYVDEHKLEEANINSKLTEMVRNVNYPEFE